MVQIFPNPKWSNNVEENFLIRCLLHLFGVFLFPLKERCAVHPFRWVSYPYRYNADTIQSGAFLMLFYLAFCISAALQYLKEMSPLKEGCSIYVNGLLGLIVCVAIHRQFFTRHPQRGILHQYSYTHSHSIRLTIKGNRVWYFFVRLRGTLKNENHTKSNFIVRGQ